MKKHMFRTITFLMITTALTICLCACGNTKSSEPDADSLTQFFLDNTSTDPSDVLMVNADDFENDGTYTAFIFVGKQNGEDDAVPYEGALWFTNGTECRKLADSGNGWWSIDGTIRCGNRNYVYINEYYATDSISYIFRVDNGKAEECSISRLGNARQTENGDVMITYGTYDSCYDKEADLLLGHTWKPYYFYYDPKNDCLAEYEGIPLGREDINKYAGFDLISQIEEQGAEITTAFYRANGILNVNYQTEDDAFVTYKNANYDCSKKTFIDAWGTGSDTLESSDFGGIYYGSICSDKE